MHVYSRPIYISENATGFVVTCYRGLVTSPVTREFPSHAEAEAFAMRKFATKYYAKACVIDETKVAAP